MATSLNPLTDNASDVDVHLKNYDIDINLRLHNDNTLLHFALRSGAGEIAGSLIKHGANVDIKNKRGQTPFTLSLSTYDKNAFAAALSKATDINAVDENGNPLMILAM